MIKKRAAAAARLAAKASPTATPGRAVLGGRGQAAARKAAITSPRTPGGGQLSRTDINEAVLEVLSIHSRVVHGAVKDTLQDVGGDGGCRANCAQNSPAVSKSPR